MSQKKKPLNLLELYKSINPSPSSLEPKPIDNSESNKKEKEKKKEQKSPLVNNLDQLKQISKTLKKPKKNNSPSTTSVSLGSNNSKSPKQQIKQQKYQQAYQECLFKGDTYFDQRQVDFGTYQYPYLLGGNFKSTHKIVLLGGFPFSALESMKWLAHNINHLDRFKYAFYILSFPFLQSEIKLNFSYPPNFEYQMAVNNGIDSKTGQTIKMNQLPVDPRFNLRNMSTVIYSVLDNLNVTQAHFIGHGLGCSVLDYLLGQFPQLALSYSRGSHFWDLTTSQIKDIDKNNQQLSSIIGYPTAHLTIPNQIPQVINPKCWCSPTFWGQVSPQDQNNLVSISQQKRQQFIIQDWEVNVVKNHYNRKQIAQVFQQWNLREETKHRQQHLMKTKIPILQFEGQDQNISTNNQDTISGTFPHSGPNNLFKGDFTENSEITGKHIRINFKISQGNIPNYQTVNLKVTSQLSKMVFIPNSANLTILENPQACAKAIYDFIKKI